MLAYWHFIGFPGAPPSGNYRCIATKTLYTAKARVCIVQAIKRQMPRCLISTRPHTHNTLNDAIEQAELPQWLSRVAEAGKRPGTESRAQERSDTRAASVSEQPHQQPSGKRGRRPTPEHGKRPTVGGQALRSRRAASG